MPPYSQAGRLLSVSSHLGKDVLLLTGFSGEEAMSRLFQYRLDLLSDRDNLATKDLLGSGLTWTVQPARGRPRHFHGQVVRFVSGGKDARGLRSYRAEVAPWLWFLTRTSDCRIFQGLSTPDIIRDIFKQYGFADFALSLRQDYPKRDYCVQYRETAFAFISRLLEQEGIFYFFRHAEGKHTLVLADHVSAHQSCSEGPVELSSDDTLPGRLRSWEHAYEFRSGQCTQTDFNLETPATSLLKSAPTLDGLPGAHKYEMFNYPGLYKTTKAGAAAAKLWMEEEEVQLDVAAGGGRCCSFALGGRFQLIKHECAAENRAYVITSISHSATETSYGTTGSGSGYENSFTCIPDNVAFRPERITVKPWVPSVQTAIVVGPPGEEIFCDKYGRVKVQFHWDRRGKKNADSSCWLRVSQMAAGKGFGALSLPRVGQEVVVGFLEGDPDRPLVLGSLYNAKNMPPYPLPHFQDYTGMIQRSVAGVPGNASEIRFETGLGQERLLIHAETDMHQHVESDSHVRVGNDHHALIANDHELRVGHNQRHNVGHNYTINVGSAVSHGVPGASGSGQAVAGGSGVGGGSPGGVDPPPPPPPPGTPPRPPGTDVGTTVRDGSTGGPAPAPDAPPGDEGDAAPDPQKATAAAPVNGNDFNPYSFKSLALQEVGIGTFQITAPNLMTITKLMDNKLAFGLEMLVCIGYNMEFNVGAKVEWCTSHIEGVLGQKMDLHPANVGVHESQNIVVATELMISSGILLALTCGPTGIVMTPASLILMCGGSMISMTPAGIVITSVGGTAVVGPFLPS